MAERPRGTVTFLFTDVEGSTQLLKRLGEGYGAALEQHQRLLREAFARHGGEEIDTQGDAFFYVFARARDAVAAAADGQRALAANNWPDDAQFRVRMGMHTAEPVLSEEGRYHGIGVHRAARIMAAGHGGQILASQATASVLADDELDGVTLRDLGQHGLKDLERPERIWELRVAGLPSAFPRLQTARAAAPPLHRRPIVIGVAAGVLAAAVAIPVFALGGGSSGESPLARVDDDSVGIVDAASGAITQEVSNVPTPTRLASGANAIWVTSSQDNSVSRIDLGTRQLRQTIKVGDGPTGVAVGGGKVWVANSLGGTVSRVDPDANTVAGSPISVGNDPTAVAFGAGSVWVTNLDDESVSRIDPVSGTVKTIDVGAAGRGIAVGDGAVWITDSARNRLVRLDPQSEQVTQTIGVGSGPTAVAWGAGAVWVANTLDGTVSKVDPATNQVRATVAVGTSPNGIAASTDSVWVSNEAGKSLVRLDSRTGAVVQKVAIGARPSALTLAGSLWVAAQPAPGAHREGTMRVDLTPAEAVIDPAVAYSNGGWSILSLTNDGLVAFKRAGGNEGIDVVPDLATSLPTPTDGGKSYTFQLRSGIRYSTGALVKASDVRASFERLFRAKTPRPDFYTGIVGGSACMRRPQSCSLARGIVTDDRSRTATFHLTAPDAEFLDKIAIPFASVLPADTAISKGADKPVPATGPYLIRSFSKKRIELVRNPRFHVWSPATRSNGFADRIVISLNPPAAAALRDVEQGRVDIAIGVTGTFGPALAQFETQHPAQVHTTPAPGTFYWYLNTLVRPFNDRRVREAVNYALDRGQLAQGVAGQAAQPTCQLLPPNFPGYRPYCPYTRDPGAGGTWTGPDLAKARALIRASGTKGAQLTFWLFRDAGAEAQLKSARAVFSQLGYRLKPRLFPSIGAYYDALGHAGRNGPQMGVNGWFADYLAASNFFAVVSCSGGFPPVFCSRSLDAAVARAKTLQIENPAAASRQWAKLDREATDLAPIVPLYTPRNVVLVSKRVGNYQYHPLFTVLLDQAWVK